MLRLGHKVLTVTNTSQMKITINALYKPKIKYVQHQSGDTKSVGSTNSVSLFEFALYILCKANTDLIEI